MSSAGDADPSDPIKLENSWKVRLKDEFSQPYMKNLKEFLKEEYKRKKTIFPRPEEYFAALNMTPFEAVKVVILGQDPYHGPGQAHGLCFSVPRHVEPPPSLKNIYKELAQDLKISPPQDGCLESWARNGVLLLNSILTVEAGRPGSHQGKGWEILTDKIIEVLNQEKEGLVFMLWGAYAQRKGQKIDRTKHLVLEAPHPSPLSAHRGFLGCRHFSKSFAYLGSTYNPFVNPLVKAEVTSKSPPVTC